MFLQHPLPPRQPHNHRPRLHPQPPEILNKLPLLPPEQPRTIPLQKRQHLLEVVEVMERSEDGKPQRRATRDLENRSIPCELTRQTGNNRCFSR